MADRQKREIRARMTRTGERYTTARRHVLAAHKAAPTTQEGFDIAPAASLLGAVSEFSDEEIEKRFNEVLDVEGNPWRLNLEELLLELADGTYEVALDDCRTSAEVLDCIIHVSAKSWGREDVVAGLVRAIDLVLDPQTHLCGRGQELGPTDWLPEDIAENIRMSGVL